MNRQLELGRVMQVGLLVACVVVTMGAGPAPPHPGAPAVDRSADVSAGRYQAPLEPLTVLHRFDPPAHPYGPGRVGVDLAARAGAGVAAAGAGTVVFAGPVAGRGVVVIAHPDGIRTEYEPVRPSVVVGELVSAGSRIGVIAGHHVGCAVACLHWGARRGTAYLDPLSLLHPLGPVRLLPWSAAALGTPVPSAARSGPRMGLFERRSQPLHRDVGVDLSGGQAGMAE